MPNIVQSIKPVRLQLDSNELLRDELNCAFNANVRFGLNVNQSADAGNALTYGAAGKGTPTKSTQLVCSIDPSSAGNFFCVGAFESEKTQEVYYEIFSEAGNHSLWVFGTENETCRKVYEGSCLNYKFPSEYRIPDHRSSLYVVYDNDNNGNKVIRSKYYVYTDGYNWQRFIDVETSIATGSFSTPYYETFYPHCDPCEFIELGVRPPYDCPKVLDLDDTTYLQESTAASGSSKLANNVWYFQYRYNLTDGRRSVYSPISTMAYTNAGNCPTQGLTSCFKIMMDAGSALVESIDLIYSNDGVNWFLYDTIKKYDDCSPSENFWERPIALSNYFNPIQPSSNCDDTGSYQTTVYTYTITVTIKSIFTVVINGDTYTSPELILSVADILYWLNSLGLGEFVMDGSNIYVASADNVYGNLTSTTPSDVDTVFSPSVAIHVVHGKANNFIYVFCGNKQCQPVDPKEPIRHFDSLPILSIAQANVDDKIAFADNLNAPYNNFGCDLPIEITATQDETCDTELVEINIDAVIHNFYADRNQAVYQLDPTTVAFGGMGILNVGGIDYEDEIASTYQQKIVNPYKNFIGRLRGTGFTAVGVQYQVGSSSPIHIPEPFSDNSRRNMMSSAYAGNYYYQRFTFKVPKGNYIFQIDSHLADGLEDSQYTSTYFYGIIDKDDYEPAGSITVDTGEREVRFTACEDFNYDHYVVIADLTKPRADVSLTADAKASCGYLKEAGTHLPIELAWVEPDNPVTICTPSTDHNGFFFSSDGGSDYTLDFKVINNACALDSPTGGSNQVNVNSKVLLVQDVICTLSNFVECCHEIISGTIKDCNGNPIAGKSVVLSYTGRYGVTNTEGEYTILAHDSAYWKHVDSETRKQKDVDNLFISPSGACLLNDCEDCDPCIDVTHVTWTKSCFNCTPATTVYNFTFDYLYKNLKGLKTGGRYGVAIKGRDHIGRESPWQFLGYHNIPTIQTNGVFAPYNLSYAITGSLDLPLWIDNVIFGVTKNLAFTFKLSWVINKVEFLDSEGNTTSSDIANTIRLYLGGINAYNTQYFFNTNSVYQFEAGDIARFISDSNGSVYSIASNNGLIDKKIFGQVDGNSITIENDPRLSDLKTGTVIEIFNSGACTNPELYYEVCPAIPVLNLSGSNEPIINSGVLQFFDTYWLTRAIPFTNQTNLPVTFVAPHPFEHHSPSDFFGDHKFSIGRAGVRNESYVQGWDQDEIAWSDSFVESGMINGLSTFRIENRKNYGVQNFGGIVAMKAQRNILFVLCENDWFVVNIALNLLQVTSDGSVVANPDYFGTADQKIGNMFGCDMRDTSTVIFEQEWVSWVDINRAAVCFSNYQSVEDVALADAKSYFIDKLKFVASKRISSFDSEWMMIHSGFDPMTKELLITAVALIESDPAEIDPTNIQYTNSEKDFVIEKSETISFNVAGKYWSGTYGFTPEFYAKYNSAKNGVELLSWAGGQSWRHHNSDVTTFNNFYGTQCFPVLKFVANKENVQQKRWLAVRVECKEALWFSDQIFTQTGQQSAIPIEAFEFRENFSEGEIMSDINTLIFDGLSALVDGDSLYGNWIKMRFLIDPAMQAEYFELESFIISATQSY